MRIVTRGCYLGLERRDDGGEPEGGCSGAAETLRLWIQISRLCCHGERSALDQDACNGHEKP